MLVVQEDDVREMRREIERIKNAVDDISHIQAQQAKADPRFMQSVLKVLSKTKARVKIYLQVNGKRSVTEVAKAAGVDVSTASRHLAALYDEGIIGAEDVKGERVYRTNNLERALNLSREVKKIADDS